MTIKEITVGGVIALIAGAVGVWQFLHSDLVPVTMAQHVSDIENVKAELRSEQSRSEERIIGAIVKFQNKWECDEAIEELEKFLLMDTDDPLIQEEMERLRDFIDENDCA